MPPLTRCESCGGETGGIDGCVMRVNELLVQAQQDARYAGVYRLAFDAFCMQHPERYCVSAKSYAAHLMGLCHGIEHAARPQTYWAIPAWLNRPPALDKPPLLKNRGDVTIASVHRAASPDEHTARVRVWAQSVWDAYATQHALARQWLKQAMAASRTAK